MKTETKEIAGADMRLTNFGVAVIVLILLAIAARFTGSHVGSANAASAPASQATAQN